MKILLINDYATPIGGAEIAVLMLRQALRNRGHDARLLSSSATTNHASSSADYACLGTTSPFRTLLQSANPWAYWQLRRTLAGFQPDIVHVNLFLTQLSPLILPLLRTVPSLYHVVWYRPVCPLGTKMLPDGTACTVTAGLPCYQNHCLPLRDWLPLMFQVKLWRRWRQAFNLIVANSETVKRSLLAAGVGPVEVVWNGVPIQPQRPALSSPPTVAFAGRLVHEKGVDLLLRALSKVTAQLPETRLVIAGDGPERDRLHRLVTDLGLSSTVSMLGHLSRPDVEKLFARAWVQVIPSRWSEPFGIVAIEAMMRGTAVIASNSGGLAEIVQEGKTGILVPADDVDALAAGLRRLLSDRALSEQMGRAGRELALVRFSEETFVDRFIQLYQLLLRAA